MKQLGVSLHYPKLKNCANVTLMTENNFERREQFQTENTCRSTDRVDSTYSDADTECYIRTAAFTGFHPIGTLKMGPDDDPFAVVDTQLR